MPTKQANTRSGRKSLYIVIVVLCVIALLAVFLLRSPKEVLSSIREKGQTYTTYEGVLGERKKISLADGTPVILNSNTKLLVPADFAKSHILLLDGEAYFDSTAYPLTVKTNILTMTVTKPAGFKMRCFESQQGATAYVLSGEVKVSKSYHSKTDDQPEMLGPGNMVLANKEIDLMEKETYQPIEMTIWLQDKLIFHDEPFMNAVRKLEEWYSTEIYVEGDPSAAGGINGEFHQASLTKVLEEIRQTAKFDYKINKNKVTIRF
ncbi:FecR family protein [Chitinophaga filiformis]|uniref:Ferric-dicitrate binding protein FerR, regulates iron transport through sigma-19 n=1 Tax=Chitinophaga filiformis TaxID=104663 RepID=A0A1G7R6C0_CHIFI|nr:FecR domain-containing protein [Chitinophaga filiformis]SDG06254.1 ferric-dicitrate binding protein FerR, regulates iron transport through sigma-19 [Chitinophaga filiformis]